MKVLTVVGARPNFMKVAPIVAAIRKHNENASTGSNGTRNEITHVLVHTGQHYDSIMSDSFFADLGLPTPDVLLGVGSGTHACQTGEVLKRFEDVLLRERPDVVIVVGDVNSTVAAALATAKIAFNEEGKRPLLAHVEAGLRSFDRTMPEEINRIVTDHVSDLLFVTERSGCKNLRAEGIEPDIVHFVGNTMIDSLHTFEEKANESRILQTLGLRVHRENGGLPVPFALLTLHRPSNVDRIETFTNILDGLDELSQRLLIVFPVHPRTRERVRAFGLETRFGIRAPQHERKTGILMTDPLGYLDFLCLMKNAELVVTDSGGIQEETTALGIRCITVRENTERPITIEVGTNILAGTDKKRIAAAVRKQIETTHPGSLPERWDGKAAERIVSTLQEVWLSQTTLKEAATTAGTI